MKHKKLLSSVLAASCILAVGSCNSGTQATRSTTAAPADTTAAAQATTTTTPATLAEEDKNVVNEIKPTYEKLENPTVKFLSSWDINPVAGKPKRVDLEFFETQYGGKIELQSCTWDDRYSKLGMLVAAGDSPDMFSAGDLDTFPKGAINNMFLPLDDYVDYSSDLWAPMSKVNEMFVSGGKHYVGACVTDAGVIMIYNKKTIEENGLEDPVELLDKGEWDWDALYNMMLKFCNREQEKFGIDGWWFETAIALTTGVPYVGMKDGKIVQNLDDPMIDTVQQFLFNIKKEDMPFPKSEYAWQIHPENVGKGKTLFYPVGIWQLYEDHSAFGDYEDQMFVPMPKCPQADAYYLPTSFEGYCIVSGAANPKGVGAWLDSVMLCRDDENAKEIGKKQAFEDYHWTQEMYDMQQRTIQLTEEHPMVDFYQSVSEDVTDIMNNPIKDSYNNGIQWSQTRETIKNSVQAELDSANDKLSAKQ